jgi:cytochrome c-type biogenesis protein CcmF
MQALSAPNKDIVQARLSVQEGSQFVGTIEPNRFFYKTSDQPVTEAAIRSSLRDDLYVLLGGWDDQGTSVTLKVFVNPLVSWIWIGGFFLLIGTLVSAWPSAVRQTAATRIPVGRGQVAGES